MEKMNLEQALNGLPQPEPSSGLDEAILGHVRRSLALENYQKAEQLLQSQSERLDGATRAQLATGMLAIREQFGAGFDQAYAAHLQENQKHQIDVASTEPDLQR